MQGEGRGIVQAARRQARFFHRTARARGRAVPLERRDANALAAYPNRPPQRSELHEPSGRRKACSIRARGVEMPGRPKGVARVSPPAGSGGAAG